MNVNIYNTKAYENKSNWTLGENKPNSNPIKPNFQKAKMNVNLYFIEDYRKKDVFADQKTNPKQSQFLQRPKSLARKSGHTQTMASYEISKKKYFLPNLPNVLVALDLW